MKKILLSFFALVSFSATLFAQVPTLTSSNSSPVPGDNYVSQSTFTTGAPQYSGGANQTWNYSTLTDSGDVVAFGVVLPSATPFADSFPGSNLSIKTLNDSVYSYFTSSTAALNLNGVATYDSTIIRYNPYSIYLQYPFSYNSFFTSDVSVKLPGFDFTFTGKDSATGDGYGSLSIPGRTFSNVLRVKYIENLSNTTISGLLTITTNVRTVSYLYFSPNTHVPVLTDILTTSTLTSTFLGNSIVTSSQSRSINYLKAFVLPVTFQSFKANLQNNNVALQWKTAQEINADHYTVQRSLTGRDFQDVASVIASGSTQGSLYNYVDKSFAGSNVPATIYYRIQETDKDGKQNVSGIAIVRGDHAIVISIYPNPASSSIRISGSDITVADAISIYDAKGSLLQQWHNYSISQPINIAGLSKGTYIVKITANGKTSATTLVKQ